MHTSSSLLPRLLYSKNASINQLVPTGIAQSVCDSLRARRFGNRLSLRAGFSASVQPVLRVHPDSYTMGTVSFPGVKWPERGADHPLHLSAEVKERVELYIYSPSGSSWLVIGWPLPYINVLQPAMLNKTSYNTPVSAECYTRNVPSVCLRHGMVLCKYQIVLSEYNNTLITRCVIATCTDWGRKSYLCLKKRRTKIGIRAY